jgi:hypothetical protein
MNLKQLNERLIAGTQSSINSIADNAISDITDKMVDKKLTTFKESNVLNIYEEYQDVILYQVLLYDTGIEFNKINGKLNWNWYRGTIYFEHTNLLNKRTGQKMKITPSDSTMFTKNYYDDYNILIDKSTSGRYRNELNQYYIVVPADSYSLRDYIEHFLHSIVGSQKRPIDFSCILRENIIEKPRKYYEHIKLCGVKLGIDRYWK